MKLFVRMIVIAIALFSVGGPLAAQSKHQRISREALAEVQAKHIASELSLDETTTQKFIDTYTQFQKELWALRPRTKRNLQKAQTDEEIDRAMRRTKKSTAPCKPVSNKARKSWNCASNITPITENSFLPNKCNKFIKRKGR